MQLKPHNTYKKIKERIALKISKALGIYQISEKLERIDKNSQRITKQIETITENTQQILMNQHFSTAYSMYETLKNECEEATFNKDKFDALLLMTMHFMESAKGYTKQTKASGIFQANWMSEQLNGKRHLDIRGVKITTQIPDEPNLKFSAWNVIFLRSLLIHTFFEDNYDKKIVETIDQRLGEGARCYRDRSFDVTIHPGDIVIDAGAWIGDFSAYAAHKGAVVYAFEPTPSTYESLCDTATLNNNKIHPVKIALSDTTGYVAFKHFDNSARNKITTDDNENTTLVRTITLDAFAEENKISKIDFIKADIQGAERNMLRGARNVLRDYAPRLAIATDHLPDDPITLKAIILEANPNYKIVQLRTVLFASVA